MKKALLWIIIFIFSAPVSAAIISNNPVENYQNEWMVFLKNKTIDLKGDGEIQIKLLANGKAEGQDFKGIWKLHKDLLIVTGKNLTKSLPGLEEFSIPKRVSYKLYKLKQINHNSFEYRYENKYFSSNCTTVCQPTPSIYLYNGGKAGNKIYKQLSKILGDESYGFLPKTGLLVKKGLSFSEQYSTTIYYRSGQDRATAERIAKGLSLYFGKVRVKSSGSSNKSYRIMIVAGSAKVTAPVSKLPSARTSL